MKLLGLLYVWYFNRNPQSRIVIYNHLIDYVEKCEKWCSKIFPGSPFNTSSYLCHAGMNSELDVVWWLRYIDWKQLEEVKEVYPYTMNRLVMRTNMSCNTPCFQNNERRIKFLNECIEKAKSKI